MQTENKKEQYLEPVGFKGTESKWRLELANRPNFVEYHIRSENGWHIAKLNQYPPEQSNLDANCKLMVASKELAKALQTISEQCHIILNEYSDSGGWDSGKMVKGWLNKIGGIAELCEAKLKEAGLTNE